MVRFGTGWDVNDHLLDIQVCGTVAIGVDGGDRHPVRGRQPRSVLAHLATAGREVRSEELADLLWGETPGPHWAGALRGVLSKLRKALDEAGGPAAASSLVSSGGVVRLDARVTTDVGRAHALATAAQGMEATALIEIVDDLELASSEIARPFLPHDESEWARAERYRIAALGDRLEHSIFRALRAAGRRTQAISRARERLATSPTDEPTHVMLIELLLEEGEVVAALDAHRRLAWMLSNEYGVEPDPELTAKVREARRSTSAAHGPPPAPPVAPAVGSTVNGKHPNAGEPFVGRDDALSLIDEAARRVAAGSGTEVIVIHGPAGIGKTRLADEATMAAADRHGLDAIWGRCRAGVDRPFGALADAISRSLGARRDLVDRLAGELPGFGLLVPDLVGGIRPDPTDPEATRDSAMAAALQAVETIADGPTALVLDDLQWASDDALALIEHVVGRTRSPLLVLLAHRDPSPAAEAMVSSISAVVPVHPVAPGALSVEEVRELCEAAQVSPGDVAAVHRRTRGVAYLVDGLVRDARRRDSPIDIGRVPPTLAEAIARRLAGLPLQLRELAETLAVLGPQVDLDGITALTRSLLDEVAGGVDDLAAAGICTIEDDGSVLMQHDLTAEAIYERIGGARRMLLHRRAAEHLESTGGPLALVAHHLELAGPGRVVQAIDARIAAGRDDLRRGAWASARDHLGAVLDRDAPPESRISALIGLGTAHLNMGHRDDSRKALDEAVELADRHDLPLLLAEAALLLVGRAGRGAADADDREQQEILERSLRALAAPGAAGEHRAREVMSSRVELELALCQLFSSDLAGRSRLVERALTRIRALPDPEPDDLAHALLGRRVVKVDGPDISDRLGDIDEVLALPRTRLRPEVRMAAHAYRHEDLLCVGRLDESRDDLRRLRDLATLHSNPYWTWSARTWEALAAIGRGDLDLAEDLSAAAAADRPGVLGATACHQVNLVDIRLLQGRADEVIPALDAAVAAFPQIPAYRAVRALALSEAGRLDDAAADLSAFASADHDLPMDSNRFLGLAVLAHVAADVGDRRAAEDLHRRLSPFRGLQVVINCYGGGGALWGPTSWALARTAAAAGQDDATTAALWRSALEESEPFPPFAERIRRDAVRSGLLAGHVGELGVVAQERQADRVGGSGAVLGDDDLGDAHVG